MTVKLGLFTMPFHHPARDYTEILEEDQEAIVLADRLGFTEAFVGEHFSSWSERITSPLIFLATLISRTSRIRFGTGVINLPQLHPATVAAHAAMFDQEVVRFGLNHRYIGRFPDRSLHRRRVKLAISLRARTAHRRALAAVQNPELDAALIGRPAH